MSIGAAIANLAAGDVPGPGFLLELAVYTAAAVLAAVLAVIDARTRLIPNRLLLPAYPATAGALVLCAGLTGEWGRTLWAVIGGATLWTGFYLYGMIGPRGHLGFGDVKLAGWLGILLGYAAQRPGPLLFAVLVAFASAAVVGLALVAARQMTLRESLPFGPFLVIGAITAIAAL